MIHASSADVTSVEQSFTTVAGTCDAAGSPGGSVDVVVEVVVDVDVDVDVVFGAVVVLDVDDVVFGGFVVDVDEPVVVDRCGVFPADAGDGSLITNSGTSSPKPIANTSRLRRLLRTITHNGTTPVHAVTPALERAQGGQFGTENTSIPGPSEAVRASDE